MSTEKTCPACGDTFRKGGMAIVLADSWITARRKRVCQRCRDRALRVVSVLAKPKRAKKKSKRVRLAFRALAPARPAADVSSYRYTIVDRKAVRH
jgi:hypothetical protein